MPNKIKIFFGFLALIALFSVYNVFNSFGGKPVPFAIIGAKNPLPEPETDADYDGLTNKEESYWNTDFQNPDTDGDKFLDGEEVASGHDPLKPGPDDILPKPSTVNITDKISSLMVSGFYAGDLNPNADPVVYNKALADISVEMLIDGESSLNPSNIPIGKTTLSSNSKKDQEKYINEIGSIIQVKLWGELVNEPRVVGLNIINSFSETAQGTNDSRQYFYSKTTHYRQVLDEVSVLAVPPSWLDIHQKILSSLQKLVINHQALGKTTDDPLKGALAMNNLMIVYQDVQPILVTISQKIKKDNLKPLNGQLWFLVNSLTNEF